MRRLLVIATVLAVALSACSQNEARPTPVPTGCVEPARRTGDVPFDDQNRATWQKELDASGPAVYGRLTDAATGAPVDQVCVTPGKPGAICWARSDADGWYLLDLGLMAAQPGFFEIFFTKNGYPEQHTVSRLISGRPRLDYQMTK
jgi:hypothetical protein